MASTWKPLDLVELGNKSLQGKTQYEGRFKGSRHSALLRLRTHSVLSKGL